MKREGFIVELWEADGDPHDWRVEFKFLPRCKDGKTKCATYDLAKRVIVINSRLKNWQGILDTALHEGMHVALGVNGPEHLVEHMEENYVELRKKLQEVISG